jgi:acyl-CoA reductase-like NAD-dependent aldehyde dehydrogenase
MAVFSNTGQICSAGTRLFVERHIYDDFVGQVAECAQTLKVGNSLNPETQIGPLVSKQQLDRVTGYLALGKQEGARSVVGGERLTEGELATGYFVPPTVFTDVRDDMRIAQEEIFGPVIAAIPFTDIEEVARRANATNFGLGSGVWTRDVSKAHRLARAIRAGSVWINCYQAMDPAVPFGASSAIFFNHGQCCCAGSRLYIQKKLFDEVTAGVVEAAQKIKLGPGFAPDTDMGPLVSQEQLQRVSGYLTSGFDQGARELSGGKRYSDRGYFVEPTVLVDTTRDMQVVREEIFGPVVTAMPFEDLHDLVRQANDTTYGLAAGVRASSWAWGAMPPWQPTFAQKHVACWRSTSAACRSSWCRHRLPPAMVGTASGLLRC